MFDRICSSNIVIASQQRNEPDFTNEQKHEILNHLYKTNPANFIYRFGSLLTDDEIKQNFDPNADYVCQILKSNRHKLCANRRYTYMQQLLADGSYFSDEAMKERSPLLYEQMIAKYKGNEANQLVTRTANGPLADFYMEHLEAINHQERVEKEYENEEYLRHDDDNDDDIESEDDEEDDDDNDNDENENKYSSTERNLYRQEFLAMQKERFLNGEDSNIDYTSIDNNENLDDIKIRERDEEEKYFDDEDPYTYNNEEQ
ncbi:unnamed protein product [Rotaria sp. Silwood2]|nr:unnamed protein product [Rotaria sp. Silwood2]CAF3149282.1 unnamed protein product [Rotaria sp. Silwood2]CAF3877217.1 unnamed protein product [Rotaria sp. Silwood2]CAF4080249.1 unnamed protein product [Rotaria sp. Silwood2]